MKPRRDGWDWIAERGGLRHSANRNIAGRGWTPQWVSQGLQLLRRRVFNSASPAPVGASTLSTQPGAHGDSCSARHGLPGIRRRGESRLLHRGNRSRGAWHPCWRCPHPGSAPRRCITVSSAGRHGRARGAGNRPGLVSLSLGRVWCSQECPLVLEILLEWRGRSTLFLFQSSFVTHPPVPCHTTLSLARHPLSEFFEHFLFSVL